MFFEFIFNKSDCEFSCINGHIYFSQKVRNPSDMVFMTMGYEQTFNFILILDEIRIIRNNVINSKQFILREFHPCINDDDFILELYSIRVFANLTQTAYCENCC